MPKNAIVLGMARSGTSMTAAIFARCGYFVAENEKQLQNADKFNPSGYWEAMQLLEANKEILAAVGFKYDNTWFHSEITEQQAEKINSLELLPQHRKLISLFESNSPWVWKDPRLCYTLGYWWRHLNQNNTSVLFLHRDNKEITNSFLRVKSSWYVDRDMTEEDFQIRIEQHMLSASKLLEMYNIPFITVHYSEYKTKPGDVAARISKHFGVKLDKNGIGYSKVADHSRFYGRFREFIHRVVLFIPRKIYRLIKK